MNNRFPSLYADNRGRLAVAIVFFLTLQAVAMGIGAFATRSIFSGLHANANESLTISLLILIGAGFLGAFGRLSANTLAERLGQSFAISFRRNFFSHLSSLAKSDLERRRIGALSLRFVGDLSAMREWASDGVTGLASAFLTTTAGLIVLWMLSPLFGYIGVISIAVCLAIMALVARALPRTQRELRRHRGKVSYRYDGTSRTCSRFAVIRAYKERAIETA